MSERATTCGKELLLDGQHMADCRDELAAETIAVFLNYAVISCGAPPEAMRKILELFA